MQTIPNMESQNCRSCILSCVLAKLSLKLSGCVILYLTTHTKIKYLKNQNKIEANGFNHSVTKIASSQNYSG